MILKASFIPPAYSFVGDIVNDAFNIQRAAACDQPVLHRENKEVRQWQVGSIHPSIHPPRWIYNNFELGVHVQILIKVEHWCANLWNSVAIIFFKRAPYLYSCSPHFTESSPHGNDLKQDDKNVFNEGWLCNFWRASLKLFKALMMTTQVWVPGKQPLWQIVLPYPFENLG